MCDRAQDRIQVFSKAGVWQRNITVIPGTGVPGLGTAGSAWDVDFSRDPRQKLMFEVDGGNEVLWIFDHAVELILGGFGRPGHQAGEFTFLHTVAVDSKGNLYTGETVGGRRVQKFTPDGNVPQKDLRIFTPAGNSAPGGNPSLQLLHYDPVKN